MLEYLVIGILLAGISVLIVTAILSRRLTMELTADEHKFLSAQKFGSYMLQSVVVRGDFTTTFAATDARNKKKVAVRILHLNFLDQASFVKEFAFKGETLKFLSEHSSGSNFIQGVDFGNVHTDRDRPFIVSDYLSGISLSRVLASYPRLSNADTYQIVRSLADSLRIAHNQNIWIRELAPQNVLLSVDSSGALVVTIANVGIPFTSLPGGVIAELKKGFYSPEDRMGDPIDERADVYALAALCYRVLKGQPFVEDKSPFDAPAEFLLPSLRTDRSERTKSTEEFIQSLESLRYTKSTIRDLSWKGVLRKLSNRQKTVHYTVRGSNALPPGGPHGSRIQKIAPVISTLVVALLIIDGGLYYWMKYHQNRVRSYLEIQSSPPGAIVEINDEPLESVTPLKDFDVSGYDQVSVKLTKEGYFQKETTLYVSEERLSLSATLVPAAEVSIVTLPPEATVRFDQEVLTPAQKIKHTAAVGDHHIVVSMDGYTSETRDFALKQGANPAVEVRLESHPAESGLPQLKSDVAAAESSARAMRLVAEEAGAPSLAQEIHQSALAQQAQGDQYAADGASPTSLQNALAAYREAESGFRRAVTEARKSSEKSASESTKVIETEKLEQLLSEMNQSKSQVSSLQDLSLGATNLFQQGKEHEQQGSSAQSSGNLAKASEEYAEAKRFYDQAFERQKRDQEQLMVQKVSMLRQRLQGEKGRIPEELKKAESFTSAESLEKEGDRARSGGNLTVAFELYTKAKEKYAEISSRGQERGSADKEILSLITAYKAALEHGNQEGLRSLLNLSSDDMSMWGAFFQNSRDIVVTVSDQHVTVISSSEAIAEFNSAISYHNLSSNSDESVPPKRTRWHLVSKGNKWVVDRVE